MVETVACRYCEAPVVLAINSRNRREPVAVAQDGALILLPSKPEDTGGVAGPRIAEVAHLLHQDHRTRAVVVSTPRYERHTCPRGRG